MGSVSPPRQSSASTAAQKAADALWGARIAGALSSRAQRAPVTAATAAWPQRVQPADPSDRSDADPPDTSGSKAVCSLDPQSVRTARPQSMPSTSALAHSPAGRNAAVCAFTAWYPAYQGASAVASAASHPQTCLQAPDVKYGASPLQEGGHLPWVEDGGAQQHRHLRHADGWRAWWWILVLTGATCLCRGGQGLQGLAGLRAEGARLQGALPRVGQAADRVPVCSLVRVRRCLAAQAVQTSAPMGCRKSRALLATSCAGWAVRSSA